MKRQPLLLQSLALFYLLFFVPMSYAQSLGSMFATDGAIEQVVTSIVASESALSQQEIVGSWHYRAAASRFESDNFLKQAGGAVVSQQINEKLSPLFTKIGISATTLTFYFSSDQQFKNTLLGKPLSGSYLLDAAASEIALTYQATSFINLGTLNSTIEHAGSTLYLYFNADKLLDVLNLLGGVTDNQYIETLTTLVDKYEGLLIGFEMGKE